MNEIIRHVDIRDNLAKFTNSAKQLTDTLDQISIEIKRVEEALERSEYNEDFEHTVLVKRVRRENALPILVNCSLSWEVSDSYNRRLLFKQKEWLVTGESKYTILPKACFEKPFIECQAKTRIEHHAKLADFLAAFNKHLQEIINPKIDLDEDVQF